MERDQSGSGKGTGTAMEMSSAWMIAAVVEVPIATTLKLHL